MRRMPIRHRIVSFPRVGMPPRGLRGISRDFSRLSPCGGQVAYVLLTRAPVAGKSQQADSPAAPRLACVKPVASVHPEPGSNSSLFKLFLISLARIPSLIVVQGLSLDGTHRYTRFRFLYYLSYYVSILKDRFRNHRRFSIAGAKVRLFFIPPNFLASFFQSFFCRFSHYLRTTTLIAGRIPHCSR